MFRFYSEVSKLYYSFSFFRGQEGLLTVKGLENRLTISVTVTSYERNETNGNVYTPMGQTTSTVYLNPVDVADDYVGAREALKKLFAIEFPGVEWRSFRQNVFTALHNAERDRVRAEAEVAAQEVESRRRELPRPSSLDSLVQILEKAGVSVIPVDLGAPRVRETKY